MRAGVERGHKNGVVAVWTERAISRVGELSGLQHCARLEAHIAQLENPVALHQQDYLHPLLLGRASTIMLTIRFGRSFETGKRRAHYARADLTAVAAGDADIHDGEHFAF